MKEYKIEGEIDEGDDEVCCGDRCNFCILVGDLRNFNYGSFGYGGVVADGFARRDMGVVLYEKIIKC